MNLRRIFAIFLTLGVVLAGAGFLALRPAPMQVRADQAVAVPIEGEPGALRLFVTLTNSGGPDRVIGAQSPLAGQISVIGPPDITLPGPGTAILAVDGAHLRMTGLDPGLRHGAVVPVTLTLASGGRIATRAILSDPVQVGEAAALGLLSLGGICRVGEGEPAPAMTLNVVPSGNGWQVAVAAKDFHFTEPVDGIGHVPGYGHGHLYLNGVKLQRMYTPGAVIGALPPGEHQVEVTLNTNDHRAYVVGDTPVTATVQIVVP